MRTTAEEQEREQILIDAGLLHKGACACGVGSGSIRARLYRCQDCGVKCCYQCRGKHVCEEAT